MTTKFEMTKYGFKNDPRNAQVVMVIGDRTLLGDVKDSYRNEATGSTHLVVHNFNGERWPIDPQVYAVDVLIRDFEGSQ